MVESCLLYYITDRTAFSGNEFLRRSRLLDKVAEAVLAGVDYIQLREKDLSTRNLESLAREAISIITKLRTENRELRTALLINSRTDIALAVQADGVHLRSDDVSPQDARTIWQNECAGLGRQALLIGMSCHSPAEVAQAAANGANLAVFAPVFEKKDAIPAGLEALHEACAKKVPVVALGGITLANAHSCLAAGASGIAAIRLFQENDIAAVVKQLRS